MSGEYAMAQAILEAEQALIYAEMDEAYKEWQEELRIEGEQDECVA